MKSKKNIFENIVWEIIEFEEHCDDKRKPIYEKGSLIRVFSDDNSQITNIDLQPLSTKEKYELPFFMGVKPCYFINDDVHYVVAIIGNDPCEWHRLILWFYKDEKGNLKFKFKVIPLYDDCVCEELETNSAILYSSAGGLGTGIGR